MLTTTSTEDMDNRTHKRTVTLQSWGWSHQGTVKHENQDSFLNWAERLMWAVADGVGSSQHGGEASKAIAGFLMDTPLPATLDEHVANVVKSLRHANTLFRKKGGSSGGSAASTVVVLLMHDGMVACLWAGDSRCYLFRDGILYQCTRDHTLRQEKVDKGELTEGEAQRMIKGNIITNAVGIKDELQLDEVRFPLRPGDRFLLCSDGLSNIISPTSLSSYLSRDTAKESVDSMVEALEGMNQPDNITFVTIFLS